MIKLADNPVVEVHDMTVSYNKSPVLWDIDISLPRHQIISIIGPNGAGKSTLLKAMMGLLPLDSGYVKIFDQPLKKVRKRISYVPQRESVDWDFPATVYDVVMMGRYSHLGLFKRPKKNDKEIVHQCMQKMGIESLYKRQISQLSGGQQQRVFLARSLAQEADIYFMDEPFSAIDMATENTIINLLKEMTTQDKTIIVVHHDLNSVKNYFDWTVMLNMRVVASGPTEETLNSKNFKETYGSQLTVLSEVGNLVKKNKAPIREN